MNDVTTCSKLRKKIHDLKSKCENDWMNQSAFVAEKGRRGRNEFLLVTQTSKILSRNRPHSYSVDRSIQIAHEVSLTSVLQVSSDMKKIEREKGWRHFFIGYTRVGSVRFRSVIMRSFPSARSLFFMGTARWTGPLGHPIVACFYRLWLGSSRVSLMRSNFITFLPGLCAETTFSIS